ncbi:MAG: rRNA maturation RNase YbeY [Azospirillaceae bacterium]
MSAAAESSGVLDLGVEVADARWPAAIVEGAERTVRRALAGGGGPADPVELGIVFTGDAEMRTLNNTWRGQDKPTNVLSFAALEGEQAGACALPLQLGDLVLAYETVAREAEEQSKSLADHATHLIVHGVLHLLGFDHITDGDAERMEALETEILAGLGIADPYADQDIAHDAGVDAAERRA